MAGREKIFIDTDMLIEVSNLRLSTDPDTLVTTTTHPSLTVTAQVFDASDVLVTGVPDPITLSEVGGFNGLFRGTIPDAANLSLGDTGTVKVVADAGTDLKRTFVLDYEVFNG